jgi:hypothetical protein
MHLQESPSGTHYAYNRVRHSRLPESPTELKSLFPLGGRALSRLFAQSLSESWRGEVGGFRPTPPGRAGFVRGTCRKMLP